MGQAKKKNPKKPPYSWMSHKYLFDSVSIIRNKVNSFKSKFTVGYMSTLFNNSTLRDTVTSYFSASRFEFKQYFYEMLLN